MEVGETETVSAAGPSLSVTTISPVAAAYPAPAAVIVTVWSPSATASSTAPIANGAEVNSPAIMVIVVLTVASLMSLLDSVTTSGLATSVLLRLTVAVVAPPDSPIDAARMTRDSASSVTSSESLTATYPVEVALMFTVCVPSSRASSTALISKVADACPAGIVTVAGTVASEVSSLLRLTMTSKVVSVLLRVTVAVVVPAFSLMESALTEMVSVS